MKRITLLVVLFVIISFLMCKITFATQKLEPGTPIHEAVRANDINKVRQLLEEGVDVNIQTEFSGQTPLHWSVVGGNNEITRLLLEKGANLEAKNFSGMTPLHLLSAAYHLERTGTLLLLLEKGAQVNTIDKNGATPLHTVAENNFAPFVKVLLEHGADIEMKHMKYGTTPLHTAILSWKPGIETIEILLAHGANINARDDTLRTPLFFAIRKDKTERLKFLLKNGADPNAQANDGETPLHSAMTEGDLSIIELLINAGAKIKIKDNWGSTPLHRAVYYGKADAVKFLIEKGANPDAKDNKSKKPLDIAREKNAFNVVNNDIVNFLTARTAEK